MRIATIDVGTNTALLLVAEVGEDGALRTLHDEERFVRLGEGVDRTGRLTAAAAGRVLAALREYRRTAAELGAQIVALAGTSASRDAANTHLLAAAVGQELGIAYEVLTGEEEALWSFRGALSAYPDIEVATVLDVGGGSTEVISASRDGGELRCLSIDVGAVRLTERFFSRLPPPEHEIAAVEAALEHALDRLPFGSGRPLVGAAGTVTSLAHVVGRDVLGRDAVIEWRGRLLGMPAHDVRALAPRVLSGRADVFAAGVMIVEAVMRRLGAAELLVSPGGLRHGLALRWLEGQHRAR